MLNMILRTMVLDQWCVWMQINRGHHDAMGAMSYKYDQIPIARGLMTILIKSNNLNLNDCDLHFFKYNGQTETG
jgi:hypothetical protein